jgi:superfamily II DNA/RNA helicase
MDGSDDETVGFSVFSKKARVETSKESEAMEAKPITMKTAVAKPIDDRLTFSDLGLNQWVVKCANDMGIVKPTPVQVNDYI